MARTSERLKLPVPELLDAVDRDFFELLVLTIDEAAASFDDIKELKEYLAKVLEKVDQSIQDSMLDYNIITSEGYNGSQPVLDQVLKGIKDHLSRLKVSVDSDKYAKDVVTSKRYGKAKSNNVEAHLQAFDNTIKEIEDTILKLSSTDIGHGPETVGSTLDGHRVSIKKLEDTIGSGLNADNIKTKRSYQDSERNVEDALRAINAKIDSGSMDTSKVLQEINDLIKDLQGATEALTHASSVKTLRSYHGGNKDVEDALRAISSKLSVTSDNSTKNTEDIARIDKILDGDEEEVGLDSDKIKHSSKSLKSTNVKDALEELFIYADDVHSKWASSVGKPLTKEMSADEKESYTKILVQGIINKYRSHGVYVNSLDEISKVDLWTISNKTYDQYLYYPYRGYIYSKVFLDFGNKSNIPMIAANELYNSRGGEYTPQRTFIRNSTNNGYYYMGDSVFSGANPLRDKPDDSKYPNSLLMDVSRVDEVSKTGRVMLRRYNKDEIRAIFAMHKTLDHRMEYGLYNYTNSDLEELLMLGIDNHALFNIYTTNIFINLKGEGGNINSPNKKLDRPALVLASDRTNTDYLTLRCTNSGCDLSQDGFLRNDKVSQIIYRDFEHLDHYGVDYSNGVYVYVYATKEHTKGKYKKGRIDRYLMYNKDAVSEHKVIRESL